MLQGFVHNIDGIVIRPSYYILYCYYLPGFYSSKTVVTFETISSSDGSKVLLPMYYCLLVMAKKLVLKMTEMIHEDLDNITTMNEKRPVHGK